MLYFSLHSFYWNTLDIKNYQNISPDCTWMNSWFRGTAPGSNFRPMIEFLEKCKEQIVDHFFGCHPGFFTTSSHALGQFDGKPKKRIFLLSDVELHPLTAQYLFPISMVFYSHRTNNVYTTALIPFNWLCDEDPGLMTCAMIIVHSSKWKGQFDFIQYICWPSTDHTQWQASRQNLSKSWMNLSKPL